MNETFGVSLTLRLNNDYFLPFWLRFVASSHYVLKFIINGHFVYGAKRVGLLAIGALYDTKRVLIKQNYHCGFAEIMTTR